MYQVTFSEQSISEINKLDSLHQLELIDMLSNVKNLLINQSNELGSFSRDSKTYYRFRPKNMRIYFEIVDDNVIYCNYVIHQHTLTDFIFRMGLPISEEQIVEQNQSFWKYLESL